MRLPALMLPLLFAACEATIDTPLPSPRPQPRAAEKPAPPVPAPSPELIAYYARVQDGLVSRGLLRTDRGGPDAPFSRDDVIRNFERVALYEEYATVDNRIVATEVRSRIHKWTAPVLIETYIGQGIAEEHAARDRAAIAGYAARLSQASGHPVRTVANGGNFHVLILTEDERKAFGPRLRQIVPGIGDVAVETVTEMSRQNYCLVFAIDRVGSGVYTQAVAVIRAEHPHLLRLSCLHEEIAQGLGLANDNPQVRPSIFNDDEEFGLLTTHDEYLLKILYDPRVEPGMNAEQAMPIVRQVAGELFPDS